MPALCPGGAGRGAGERPTVAWEGAFRHEDLSEELENAFAVVLEDTAHLPSLERPDLFDPLLMEFLEAVTGQVEGEGEE